MTPTELPQAAFSGQPRTSAVIFSGKAMEYTRLWLVNLLFSILTLGIYSAWAKVRNSQYMHGHTQLDGHRFQYHATGWQILRGRIIALIVFALFTVVTNLNPILALVGYLVFLVALPWLITQGIRFSLRMTSYRNVHFSYTGSYGGTLVNFLLLPILAMFTFYLAMPWVVQRMQKYVLDNITYGGKKFEANTEIGFYYLTTLAAIAMGISGLFVGFLIATFFGGLSSFALAEMGSPELFLSALSGAIIPLFIIMMLTNYLVVAVFQAMIRNHVAANLKCDDVARFASNVEVKSYALLMLTNALLMLVTLGLAYPATQVRKLNYLANKTQVTLTPAIDELVNTVESGDSAFGEEAAGFFDADVSLG